MSRPCPVWLTVAAVTRLAKPGSTATMEPALVHPIKRFVATPVFDSVKIQVTVGHAEVPALQDKFVWRGCAKPVQTTRPCATVSVVLLLLDAATTRVSILPPMGLTAELVERPVRTDEFVVVGSVWTSSRTPNIVELVGPLVVWASRVVQGCVSFSIPTETTVAHVAMLAPAGKVAATETVGKSPPMTTIVALVASLVGAERFAATESARI